MGNWPARHELSCWQGRKTSTQTNNTNKKLTDCTTSWAPLFILNAWTPKRHLVARQWSTVCRWPFDDRATVLWSRPPVGRLSSNDRQTVATLYRSPNPKKSVNNGRKIITWHLQQNKIDRQEKQPNSGTTSADCPSTVALFWPHRHQPLVGLGNVTEVLRRHFILPIILMGATMGFYCIKNAVNESTQFYIRGFILFMHYACLHCFNPVSLVLCNVWHFYRRIHWSFLVPSRKKVVSSKKKRKEKVSFLREKNSFLREIFSFLQEKISFLREKISFLRKIFSFVREKFLFAREILSFFEKNSRSEKKYSRLFEKNSRSDEKYSRLYEKNSRLFEKKQKLFGFQFDPYRLS